jgi:hypothetical protein
VAPAASSPAAVPAPPAVPPAPAPPAKWDPSDKPFGIGVSTVLKNPISMVTGHAGPLSITYAANPWGPITRNIFWCVDLTVSTPFTYFNPTPGISVGPAFIVAEIPRGFFILEPSVGYSHTFDFNNGSPTVVSEVVGGKTVNKTISDPTVHHSDSINVALAPGFPLKSGFIVAFPIVVNDTINQAASPTHSGSVIFAFKLGYFLY